MIKIEQVSVYGLEEAIRGMRNPKNSWNRSDSGICGGGDNHMGCEHCAEYDCGHSYDKNFHVGKNDHNLMSHLASGGPVHAKYRRMIVVYLDITAPLYGWKEFDTYKVGTVANSCSTMHKIAAKEFELDDFSHEHLGVTIPSEKNDGDECYQNLWLETMKRVVSDLNVARGYYIREQDAELKKDYWWQMIQLLPSSYNQKRTVMLSYEVLANIYYWRNNHKLDEWREFCKWIETLPYSELITVNSKEES